MNELLEDQNIDQNLGLVQVTDCQQTITDLDSSGDEIVLTDARRDESVAEMSRQAIKHTEDIAEPHALAQSESLKPKPLERAIDFDLFSDSDRIKRVAVDAKNARNSTQPNRYIDEIVKRLLPGWSLKHNVYIVDGDTRKIFTRVLPKEVPRFDYGAVENDRRKIEVTTKGDQTMLHLSVDETTGLDCLLLILLESNFRKAEGLGKAIGKS